jgi:hypothetical protein
MEAIVVCEPHSIVISCPLCPLDCEFGP